MKQLQPLAVPFAFCSLLAVSISAVSVSTVACADESAANLNLGANNYSIYSRNEYSMLSPWRDNALWNQPQGKQSNVTRHAFTQALAQQIPLLSLVGSWRNTFRGQGATARREWKFGGGGPEATTLSLGTQSLPQYQFLGLGGNATGVGLTSGRFSFGTTVVSGLMQKFADSYDSATEGTKTPTARDASTYTWMTAQALNNNRGTLDLVMMRVNRDTTPGQSDDKKMVSGTSMGMRADLKLWADWKMRGEWMNNRRQNGEAASAWHLEMNGPLRNPLGVAQINYWMDARQPGFTAMNDMTLSDGYSNMRLVMQQQIKFGDMQTALQWTQTDNNNLALQIGNGGQRDASTTEAKADLSWKLSPVLFVSANYLDFKSDKTIANGALSNDASSNNETAKANLNWQIFPDLATTLNVSSQNTEQSSSNGNIVYSNASNRQESHADLNWKVSPEITATGSVSALNNDVKSASGSSLNLDKLNSQDARANLKWKLTPHVSVLANVGATDSERKVGNVPEVLDATQTHRAEIGGGLQWQLSRALALTATTSQVQVSSDLLRANAALSEPASRLQDQQLALGLAHRTKAGSWNLQVTQHTLNDSASRNLSSKGQTISLQTEHQLLPNLRLKGAWNLSSDADLANRLANERAARSVEAQWSPNSRSNLSINYSDWDNLQSRPRDATSLGSQQFGLRFNWGSAVQGNGLGLAVEYAKQDTIDPNQREHYKIGLTYK